MSKRRQRRKRHDDSTSDTGTDLTDVADLAMTATRYSDSSKSYRRSSEPSRRRKNSSTPETIEEIVNETFFLKHEEDRPFLTKKRVVFTAGIIFGLTIAWLMGQRTTEISNYISLAFSDLDFASMLPANILVDELLGNITLFLRPNITLLEDKEFYPALDMVSEGVKSYYPVVLIPGIVSTGLESWSTSNCSRPYFRKRMWGTTTMFRAVLLDKMCWIETMKLDPITGLDPPSFKLRSAQGLDAADYLFPGYWVWGKMIQNFAAIGYDNNNMHLAAYDWRLSFSNLEVRDQYFSKLKSTLELAKKVDGRKNVIVSHSMGGLVTLYFFKWVESPTGGNGGPNWVNEYVEAFVNLGGPLLGLPKALSALLSGEMRDTVELGAFGIYVLERFFSKLERADLFRTWGGLFSMLPKGGEEVWGTEHQAPDDRDDVDGTYGSMLTIRSLVKKKENTSELSGTVKVKNHTCRSGVDFLQKHTPKRFNNMLTRDYSFGIVTNEEQMQEIKEDRTKWTNVLESQLPNAPNMTIYCLYGYGKETERKYYYSREQMEGDEDEDVDDVEDENHEKHKRFSDELRGLLKNLFIDSSVNSEKDPRIKSGVHNGEGDGTVPLISLGYMCTEGWKNPLYNPAGIKIITREFQHELGPALDLRGGERTADHVDILGNYELTKDILKIASGRGKELDDRITSAIREYAAKVKL
ncbi:Lecithin:cholesterol acyltransferase-domain-containing protein [Glomus cerebriforme]|uniref:Lecithin:cholesterol acyltransferase-domain-containing protein n=1 Tax=Glomus cerebriforme TaxID=658196 RepID=A0A397TCN2_9GLOM|nr:Lecithin:cholesterol acyltransferase-domain-containing protein [Glomus cerebriforme]